MSRSRSSVERAEGERVQSAETQGGGPGPTACRGAEPTSDRNYGIELHRNLNEPVLHEYTLFFHVTLFGH